LITLTVISAVITLLIAKVYKYTAYIMSHSYLSTNNQQSCPWHQVKCFIACDTAMHYKVIPDHAVANSKISANISEMVQYSHLLLSINRIL